MELLNEFVNFCNREGISLENPDDYLPWYRCWVNGYNTSLILFAIWKDGDQLTAMGRNIKNELLREEK